MNLGRWHLYATTKTQAGDGIGLYDAEFDGYHMACSGPYPDPQAPTLLVLTNKQPKGLWIWLVHPKDDPKEEITGNAESAAGAFLDAMRAVRQRKQAKGADTNAK